MHVLLGRFRWLTAAIVVALVAASCGDDGSTTADSSEASGTSTSAAEPVSGGEVTMLLPNEIGSMDPLRATGSTLDATRMFAVYGALITAIPDRAEVVPVLASSFEPNDDFTSWTMTLREGLTFTDGSTLDAEAVRANWERIADPANASPGFTTASSIAEITVVDPLTLRLDLVGPNSGFANTLSRSSLNYIASAKAIAEGHDLSSEPIGAGPFIQQDWIRGDSSTLVRNPDWYDAPRPYVDTLIFRPVLDNGQLVDTVVTGGAQIGYSQSPAVVDAALEQHDDYVSFGNVQHSGRPLALNNSKPPFDDVRARRVLALGVDRQFVVDTANPGGDAAEGFTAPDTLWSSDHAELPAYDPEAAQLLVDEIVADTGQPLQFAISTSNSAHIQAAAKAIQTAMSQYDGVEVDVDVLDGPTFVQRGLARDYEAMIWGFPWIDPEPGLYNAIHSDLRTNYTAYSNTAVDAALDEARTLGDIDERITTYEPVFTALAEDIPFIPLFHAENLYLHSSALHIGQDSLYDEGNLRTDLMWLEQ